MSDQLRESKTEMPLEPLSKRDVLFEIGTEEIPSSFIIQALDSICQKFSSSLEKISIPFGEIKTYGTPRRLVMHAKSIPTHRLLVDKLVLGPPWRVAFDSNNNPTKAVEGFLKTNNITLDDIIKEETSKGTYVACRKKEGGEPVIPFLSQILSDIVKSIVFKKSMRWADFEIRFARPIHSFLALFGDEIIPFELFDIASDNKSFGLRYLGKPSFTVNNFDDYIRKCKESFVEIDPLVRQAKIEDGLRHFALSQNGVCDNDAALVLDTAYVTEYPQVIMGNFDKSFLSLPKEVSVTVMKHHQRYFPVYDKTGNLLPIFLAVANTPVENTDIIVHGNERVLRARLSDASFFFQLDSKKPLEENVLLLNGIIFHAKLGNSYQKVERIRRVSSYIAKKLFPENDQVHALVDRSAFLAKNDLVTKMVGEFPELQGIMGSIYAKMMGEDDAVSIAIREHYYPLQSKGALPSTDIASIVSIADKIDSIVAFIAIGLSPTATSDPFSLRRFSMGIINILIERNWDLSLIDMIDYALDGIMDKAKRTKEEIQSEVLEFFTIRFKGIMVSKAGRPDVVDAVLATGFNFVSDAYARYNALNDMINSGDVQNLLTSFKRAVNISKDQKDDGISVIKDLLEVENNLYQTYIRVQEEYLSAVKRKDYSTAFSHLLEFKEPIDRFFEQIMVMDTDLEKRSRRLSIIHRIVTLLKSVADFSRISIDAV